MLLAQRAAVAMPFGHEVQRLARQGVVQRLRQRGGIGYDEAVGCAHDEVALDRRDIALGWRDRVALLGEILAGHLAGGFVPALAGVFTAAALAALPACAAAWALPVRLSPALAPRVAST